MKHAFISLLLWLAMAMPFSGYAQFTMNDITFWVGSGSQSAALVIDFNDGTNPQCFAWGYRFDGGSVTAEDMIAAIDSADHALNIVSMSGFVSDITYLSHAGIGGNPDYFGTFNGDGDTSNWTANLGTSMVLTDSVWFGFSYTGWDSLFNPLLMPGLPVAASPLNGYGEISVFNTIIYPNPVRDVFTIHRFAAFDRMQIFDSNGKRVFESEILDDQTEYSLGSVPAGFYYALFYIGENTIHGELIIKE